MDNIILIYFFKYVKILYRFFYVDMSYSIALAFILPILIFSCQNTVQHQSVNQENNVSAYLTYKRTALSKELLKSWPLMDIAVDSIPGISLEKAKKIVQRRNTEPVLVAVIDSGVEIDHIELCDMIWKNEDELPDNEVDDDLNGKIDDTLGWNFLGETSFAPLAITRIVRKGEYQTIDELNVQNRAVYSQYNVLKTMYEKQAVKVADSYEQISKLFNSGERTGFTMQIYNRRAIEKEYHYNTSFDPRRVIGDDPQNINDIDYGNGNVSPRRQDEVHGTHVSGIILNVTKKFDMGITLMPIRAIPKGDEYDKDVALAIRYAVDNGAKVINMSFSKPYSEYSRWVYEAIEYAAEKDVLLVHGAGNSSMNVDTVMIYPNDHQGNEKEFVDNFLNVGASTRFYNKKLVAPFSNFGKANVDIFAPGVDIYSAVPGDGYDYNNGTSMAAPLVAGVAAVIRSYYPELSAADVKRIIMISGLRIPFEVVVPGKVIETTPFDNICKSGRILNGYQALVEADRIAKEKNF